MAIPRPQAVGPPPSGTARAKGKALRTRVARSSHGAWVPAGDRRDPVAILEEQNANRLAGLVPVRMGRMLESPFAFFRGAAAVMASDLATTPITGIDVQACGDAHLLNFGLYGSPERALLFDLNDFDEALRAPWEWDIKRLAASATVAARQNGCDDATAAEITRAGVRSYREHVAMLAEMTALDVFYARVDAEAALALSKTAKLDAQKQVAKAKQNTSARALNKLTVSNSKGVPRLVDQPPILAHLPELDHKKIIQGFLEQYRKTLRPDVRLLVKGFELVDVALKVVGVGSVGTRCFIALLLDRSGAPLFLQVKEAEKSVLEPYCKKATVTQQGRRVVDGQHIMQAVSDVFLGWATADDGRDFYVRQYKDMKGSADIPALQPAGLVEYLELCGWTLARAHAQSRRPDEIAAYLGSSDQFDEGVTRFAKAYADQNEIDHRRLAAAVKSGRVAAEHGV
jgi:uncharacterized protein (DUF2252 family)